MGNNLNRISMWTEFKIVGLLLVPHSRKAVARMCNVSVSTVALVKARWPLFFWQTKRRYKIFGGKFNGQYNEKTFQNRKVSTKRFPGTYPTPD